MCDLSNVAFKEMLFKWHFLHRIMTVSKKLSVIKCSFCQPSNRDQETVVVGSRPLKTVKQTSFIPIYSADTPVYAAVTPTQVVVTSDLRLTPA